MTVEQMFSTGTDKMEKAIGQMRKEFALKYGPLTANYYDRMNNEWTWVTQKMPWEGEC